MVKKTKSIDNLINKLKENIKIAVSQFGYIPNKAKSKQLIYDDLKAMLINKPKLVYDEKYMQEDIEIAKDLINRMATDDREDTNLINELEGRDSIINSCAVVTLNTKLSLGTAALLQRLAGDEIPLELSVSISNTNMTNKLKNYIDDKYEIIDEEGNTKYLVYLDKNNTYLTFK